MSQAISCTGAILIGGHSTRMGSAKHKLPLSNGWAMLDHVQDAVAAACTRVVLVGGRHDATNQSHLQDIRPSSGPLGGVEAVLASNIDSQYLICPCDLPLISADLLRMLLVSPQALASVFHVEGRKELEPLPARIRAEALPVVRRLLNAQQRSAWKLMKELAPHVVSISATQALALHNVNTSRDYQEALRLLSTQPQLRVAITRLR